MTNLRILTRSSSGSGDDHQSIRHIDQSEFYQEKSSDIPTENTSRQDDNASTISEQSAYLDLIQHFGFRVDDGLFDEGLSDTEEESDGASEIEEGANLTEALSEYRKATTYLRSVP